MRSNQIHLIDMHSEQDKDYQFIMNYQDQLTKVSILRQLKTKTTEQTTYQVLNIFYLFGVAYIPHNDSGR